MTETVPIVDDPNRDYGDKIVAVEPGGVEFIPLDERHGTPAPAAVDLDLAEPRVRHGRRRHPRPAVLRAVVLAGVLGDRARAPRWARSRRASCRRWGPGHGLPQMVHQPQPRSASSATSSRPGINAVVAGHRLVRGQQRQRRARAARLIGAPAEGAVPGHRGRGRRAAASPSSATTSCRPSSGTPSRSSRVIFVVASIWVLTKAHPGGRRRRPIPGGWLIMVGATFGYAAGWNPYASDYTRYLAPETPRVPVGVFAGLGVFCLLRAARDRRRGASSRRRQSALGTRARSPTCCRPGSASSLCCRIVRRGGRGQRAQRLLRLDVVHGARRAAADALGAGRGRRWCFGVTRLHRRAGRPQERRRQLRELPARDRLLDRSVARRGARRPAASPRHATSRRCSATAGTELGRPDRDGARHARVHLAVLQPGRSTTA